MHDPRLRIYINDHLAMLVGAAELADRAASGNPQTPLGDSLKLMAREMQAEAKVLENMLTQVKGTQNVIKQGLAWLAEKAGRFKLNDALFEYSDLSRLLELEVLSAAALERRLFWENLEATRSNDERLVEFEFPVYRLRAQSDLDKLDVFRAEAAKKAL